MNLARIVALRAGLPYETAGQTVNRFCSSGLQSIAVAAQQIMAGMGDSIIAGGVESMSLVPMIGNKFVPNPYLAVGISRRLPGHGVDGRERGEAVRGLPRGPGRLCPALAPAGGGGTGGGQV